MFEWFEKTILGIIILSALGSIIGFFLIRALTKPLKHLPPTSSWPKYFPFYAIGYLDETFFSVCEKENDMPRVILYVQFLSTRLLISLALMLFFAVLAYRSLRIPLSLTIASYLYVVAVCISGFYLLLDLLSLCHAYEKFIKPKRNGYAKEWRSR
jgi:hypothetical protein